MKYPFFASFILFIILLKLRMSHLEKREIKDNDSFFKRETEANSIRRKPLDALNYVKIPFHRLPASFDETLVELSQQKIVNFTGYTNTDLKLMYGPANIPLLSEYDAAFTELVCYLQKWADELIQKNEQQDALLVLEYAIEIGSDIYASYKALAELYLETNQADKIRNLKEQADSLRSLNKKKILAMLSQMDMTALLG